MVTEADVHTEAQRYMALPYRIELAPGDGGWFVAIPDLLGCMSQGRTQDEALAMIREAQELWLEGAVEKGLPIPEPGAADKYSGRFIIRVPKDVHRDLAAAAARQGVSLNLYVASTLARAVGRPSSDGNGSGQRDEQGDERNYDE